MANVKAIIDVDINTSPAAAGLRSLQGQFNAFAQTLNTANASHSRFAKETTQQLSGLVNASQFFTAETVRMRTAASQLDVTLAKGGASMGQFFSARFRKDGLAAAQVMSLANARASAMQTQFIATGQAANGMRTALAIRPLQAFNSAAVVNAQKLAIQRAMLNQATTSMINFGKNTQWAGRQLMVGFTVPLTIFAGVAGKAFRDLEKEAVNFRKVYGDIFTTDVEVERALEGVRDLSKEFTRYGVEAKKTMQLAAIAAQAGQQGAQLMAATTQATRLAVLGDMENQDAMRTTIALQSAFKMSNEELAESINFLNMVENSSVLALQDVADAIPRVAPVIQGLGGDVKDLSVMLVAMREGGVSAAEAANGLKSSLGRLITPSKQARDMAESFGINLDRIVRKNAGDVLGTVTELATAMKSLGQIEQQQLLSTIFGKFQYARIGALFENITRDGSQAQKVMEMMAMSTEDMAKTAEQELSAIENSVSTKFTASIERMKIAIAPIGEMFVKMALPIVNFLAKIAESFNNLPDFAKNFIAFGSALIGLVIPAGTMFAGLLMNLIGTLIKVGHLVGLAFKGFISGGISGAINNVSQALNYMSLEQIDAKNSAAQLAGATGLANDAFVKQVGAAAGARSATNQLGIAYDILYQKIMKIVSANSAAFGPGMAAMGAARVAGPATARAAARGITLTRLNKGGTAPGTGNKDTVPAILTPGEFVVNKQATQENLPILHAINNGKNIPGFNKGGQIPGMQYFNRFMAQRVVQPSLITTRDDLLAKMAALQGFRPSEPVTRQSVRIGSMSRSESIYQKLMAKNADTSTKNSRVVRFAVEQLGISPGELGLKTRGNFGFALTQESNMRMANGTLTRQELLQDIMNPASLNPLSDQFSRYFKMGVDREKFLKIFRSSANSLPVDLITNKRFEQVSRRALYQYLRSEKVPREQAGNFMKDILSQTEVSSGLSLGRLEEALALRGINATRSGRKDFYVNHQGEQLNLGRLLGQELDSLAKPSDIIRFTRQRDSKSLVPRGLVFAHANKGGMIPGVQEMVIGGRVLSFAQQLARKAASARSRDIPNVFSYGRRSWKAKGAAGAITSEYIQSLPTKQRSAAATAISEYSQSLTRSPTAPESLRTRTAKTIATGHISNGLDQFLIARGLPSIAQFKGRRTHATHLTRALVRGGKRFVSRYTADYSEQTNLKANAGSLTPEEFIKNDLLRPGKGGRYGKYENIFDAAKIDPSQRNALELAIDREIKTTLRQPHNKNKFIGDNPGEGLITLEEMVKPIIDRNVISAGGKGASSAIRSLSTRNVLRKNKGGMIPGGEVDPSRGLYGRIGVGALKLLRSYMAGNFEVMENAQTRKTIMGLAKPMSGTFYRGTQLGGGALPKHIEKAMRQAEKTGDFSGLIGKRFRMRASDWSTDKGTATRFTEMNPIKNKRDFLLYEKGVDETALREASANLRIVREEGGLGGRPQSLIDEWKKTVDFSQKSLLRINKELEKIGELSPLILKAQGKIKGVPASQLISDATYRGKPISENNVISSSGMYEIRRASRGSLDLVPVQSRNMGGPIFESARKTIVPGVGNTDTVPAALTPGEFVINKQATKQNLGLLHAINSGKAIGMNKGGGVAEQGRMFYGNMGQDIRKMMTAFGSQGMRITKEEAALYIKQGIKISDVRKGILPQRGIGGTGGMGGMRGMGASMGMGMGGMGVMMIGQQMQASAAERGETSAVGTALSTGGMGLSMASILPFLPFAKILAPVVLAAGAAAGGLYILRKISDDIARKGQELGSNMGGAANALNEIAEMAGMATPLQKAAKLQLGITEKEEALLQESGAVQSIIQSESGQKFIDELSKLTSAERYEKLLSYIQYGVATDIFDMQTAKAFGKTIAAEIGDPAIGAAVAQRIGTQKAGAQGLINLAQERVQRIDPLIARTQGQDVIGSMDANKIIGGSLQIIQDFANAEALARQQFAEGEISYDELSAIIERSAEVQNSYTDAVQGALEKTDALGSTMLGLRDTLIASGLTEEQASAIEKAGQNVVFEINQKDIDVGKFIISSLSGGPAFGAARAQIKDLDLLGRGQAGFRQAFLSKDKTPGAVAGAIFGGEVREVDEKLTAQLSTLTQAMALTEEDIVAFGTLLSENKNLSDKFDQLIDQGVGEARAAQGIVLAQKAIEGQFLGGAGRRFEAGERESLEASLKEKPSSLRGAEQQDEARRILAEFDALEKKKIEIAAEISTKGIDPVAFETYINSIPQFKQLKIAAAISEMTPESATRFLSDAQILGSSVGNEIGLGIQESPAYKEALDKGQTEPLVKAFREASEAGVSESVIKYAIETEGANDPEDLKNKIQSLTDSTKSINELPDEMIKGLGINLEKPEDIEKFGPIASQLAANWNIIENLNPNLDLVAAMEFLTMENGKPKNPLRAAAGVEKLNKAYKNLGSKDSKVRKQAIFEIATAYAGQEGGDFTPEDVEKSLATLRENFANLDKMDPQIVTEILKIQLKTDVQGLKEATEILDLVASLANIQDPQEIARTKRRIDTLQASQRDGEEAALARQKAIASTMPVASSGGGGGQKPIIQQLQDEFKNLQSFYNSLNEYINSKTREFQGVIAGPFAPQFIEYLKSQGEEGLKVLKGSTDKLKKAYDAFIKVQQQQTANFIQTLPANIFAQARATQGEALVRGQLAGQGILGGVSDSIVESLGAGGLAAYASGREKRTRNRQRKAGTRKGKRETFTAEEQTALDQVKQAAGPKTAAATQELGLRTAELEIRNQNTELENLQKFAGMNIPGDIAQQLLSMGVSAKTAADQPKRFQAIVKGLEEIQKGQNILKIRQAFEDMGKDIQGTMNIMAAIPGISQQGIDAIKGLGIDISSLSPDDIRNVNAGLIAMERAAEMAKTPVEKLQENLGSQINLIQAEIEKFNRLEIRPLELNISRIQKEMHPYQDEIRNLEKLIKPLSKEVENFNEQIDRQQRLIRPLNKDIEKLREEEDELNKHYDERSKVLEQVSRANEKVIAQQKGQLDIASALSRGDIAGAARATRELQATMAQQRMDDAKDALEKEREDKRLEITRQIEEKEKQIKVINEEIERIQGEIEIRQDSIKEFTKLIAAENDKIAIKQKEIEGIQRGIEASKQRQLDLEEKIYKTQLLQNMLETKKAIQAAARANRLGEVEMLRGQLSTQQQIIGSDTSFAEIPGFDAVMQEITPMLTMNAQELLNSSAVIGMSAAELSNKLFEAKENLPPHVQALIDSWERDVTGAFINPEDGAPFQIGQLITEMSNAGVNLAGLFVPESANLVDNMAKAGENTAIMARITDQIVEGFQTIRKRINEKISEAYGAVNALNASIQQSKKDAQRQGTNPGVSVLPSNASAKMFAFGGMISYKGSTERAPGMMMGGKMKKYANGSFVPGIGITDSVPALLTPGEFVVRKPVAEAFGPLLQSLNSQIYPQMQQFAMGGFAGSGMNSMFPSFKGVSRIGAFPTMSGTSRSISFGGTQGTAQGAGVNVEYNYSVNVNAETNASPDDIANAVVYKFRRMEARQVKGTRIG